MKMILLAALLMALPIGAAAADPEPTDPGCAHSNPALDWVADNTTRCRGHYIDPLAGADRDADPAQASLDVTAKESALHGETLRLRGDVQAQQGYRHLRAEQADYDRATGQGNLRGNVELREPGLLLRGSAGRFNTTDGSAGLDNGQFVLHQQHTQGSASLITRHPDKSVELDDARYSYCPPPPTGKRELWLLHASNVQLNTQTGTGRARHARLRVAGVPVAYTPYLEFPIDGRRKSGFLWPEVDSADGGVNLTLPYYFNLAPNLDATFVPRHIAERGTLAELELRHLGRHTGYWELGGAWIEEDDEYQTRFPGEGGDRWLTSARHRGLFRQRWRTEVDFTNLSDRDYLSDLGTTTLQASQSTHLPRRGAVDYLGDGWTAQLRVEEHQTIARDISGKPYRKLPQLRLQRTGTERNFHPNVLFESNYTRFDHDNLVDGGRWYNSLGVNYPMRWHWGFLKPTMQYRHIAYRLGDDITFRGGVDDSPTVGAPLLSVDGGLFLERQSAWGVQTLEPRVHYLWAEHEDQRGLPTFDSAELNFGYGQLFRQTRFSGRDRLDDANQLAVGVTSRLLDPNTGRQKFAASIGQLYYFDDRRVTLGTPSSTDLRNNSSIVTQFAATPAGPLSLRTTLRWNTGGNELDRGYAQLGWRRAGRLLNLNYSYRRNYFIVSQSNPPGSPPQRRDLSQLGLSAHLPVNSRWGLFLHSQYDLDEGDRINDMLGIEYNGCCWRARLVHQRHLNQRQTLVEHDSAIYLEFQLKGLGGIGGRVGNMLEELIRGYENRDN